MIICNFISLWVFAICMENFWSLKLHFAWTHANVNSEVTSHQSEILPWSEISDQFGFFWVSFKHALKSPYQAGKDVLDLKCSFQLQWNKGSCDSFNEKTLSDPSHSIWFPPLGETKLIIWSSGKTAKRIGLVDLQNKNNIIWFLGSVFF